MSGRAGMAKWRGFLVCLGMVYAIMLACTSSAMADTGGIIHLAPSSPDIISLNTAIGSLEDSNLSLDPETVLALPATDFDIINGIPSGGYSHSAFWYRIMLEIEGDVQTKRYLDIRPGYLNRIDVYIAQTGSGDIIWQTRMGDHLAASQRPMIAQTHIIPFPDLPAGSYDVLIRTQSNSTQFLIADLKTSQALIREKAKSLATSSIFIGIMIMVALVYIALGWITRDQAITIYGIGMVALTGLSFGLDGLLLLVVQPEWPLANDLLVGSSTALNTASAIILWVTVLEIHKQYPRYARIIYVYCIIMAMGALTATTPWYVEFGRYVQLTHCLILLSFVMILMVRIGRNPAKIILWVYLLVLALPTVGVTVYMLALIKIIPMSQAVLALYPISLTFHLFLMSIVMGFRVAGIDRDRLRAAKTAAITQHMVQEQRKLVSMLSHEFRTPLAVIQRSAEMVALQFNASDDGISNRLARIQDQAKKLSRLVDVFLSRDNLDGGKLALARELVPAQEFLGQFAHNHTRENADILFAFNGDGDYDLYIDVTLLGLALNNVIENARLYKPGQPVLMNCTILTGPVIAISIPHRSDALTETEISRIRNSLFRGRNADTGYGLGLHITQRIVTAHGGHVRVDDSPEGGVDINLYLPVEYADPETGATPR
ncbi:MAG: sensor histidine kinase [Pseudomonadota bacterium]